MSADAHDAPTGSALHRCSPFPLTPCAGAVYTSPGKHRGVRGDEPAPTSVKNMPHMRTKANAGSLHACWRSLHAFPL